MYWLCKLSLKILSGIDPKCQIVWIKIRLKKIVGLIWTQTVWKGYQQMTEVSKVFHMSMKVICIGSHYVLELCFNVRQSEYGQKSTFTDYKPECASLITSLNACYGYFVWSPNGSSIG